MLRSHTNCPSIPPIFLLRSRVVETVITCSGDEDDAYTTLFIKTLDRPGLLVEIVKVLKDININVVSAEARPSNMSIVLLTCCAF